MRRSEEDERRKYELSWCERNVERMEGELLTKRADALRVAGRRRRGRSRLRWEDCVKRYLKGVESESEGWGRGRNGDGSETGSVKGGKREISTIRSGAILTPDFRDKDESNNNFKQVI